MAQSNFTLTLKTNEALTLAAEAEIDFPLPQPWPKEISADITWGTDKHGSWTSVSYDANESKADGEPCDLVKIFMKKLIGSVDTFDTRLFYRLNDRDVGYRQLIRAIKKKNATKK